MNESIWKTGTNEKLYGKINDEKILNEEVDICIIGAGITGITCAYELSELGYSVNIIEKNEVCSGTTGNTTGKITSQHNAFYNYLINSFDEEIAKKYLEANEKAINQIEKRIEKENIDCDFEKLTSYIYTDKKEEIQILEKEYETLNKLGFESSYVKDLDLPFQIEGAIGFKNQAQFNAVKYVNGLLERIEKNNVKIYTHTKAIDIDKFDEEYIVKTDKGNIKAKFVIIASHYPFLKLQGLYSAKMYQSMSYLIAIETKKELPKGMYISVSNPNLSIRRAKYEGKEILLIGGGDHKTGKYVTYEQAYGRLEEFAKKYYPDAKILKKWNAEDCISLDKLPYIGQVSSFLPNVYVATGYKKWGMTLSNVATDIIVDSIRGRKNPYADIFSSLRLQPVKNYEEMKNMIIDSSKGLIINKLKQTDILESELPNDCGKIIEIENQKVGVYKDKNGRLLAINPICTHLGCLLTWNQIDRTWDCPCHGSRFRYDGKNICDPAFNDLEVVEIK